MQAAHLPGLCLLQNTAQSMRLCVLATISVHSTQLVSRGLKLPTHVGTNVQLHKPSLQLHMMHMP